MSHSCTGHMLYAEVTHFPSLFFVVQIYFKCCNTYTTTPHPERHSMQDACTRSVESPKVCPSLRIDTRQLLHDSVLSHALCLIHDRGTTHACTPEANAPTNAFFCPLFLFQICLNYFFRQKYCIPPCFPNRSITSYQGYSPALFFVIPNYFTCF